MLFETKKIRLETLGEYLTETRKSLKLSLKEVASKTGIQEKFLKALETGEYKLLPADVYALGFLKQLANFYSVEPKEFIKQYQKERNIYLQLKSLPSAPSSFIKKIFSRLVITPKIISLSLAGGSIAILLIYLVVQVVQVNRMPSLEIYEPKDQQIIKESVVNISGKTSPGITLTVNGQNIYVDKNGEFKSQVSLSPGPKEMVFIAKTRFDKKTEKTLRVIGQAAENNDNKVNLKLYFTSEVILSYDIDEQSTQTEKYNSGDVRLLLAKSKIVISTSNAGGTRAELNGQNLGVLGKQGEKLENIRFSSEGDNIISN